MGEAKRRETERADCVSICLNSPAFVIFFLDTEGEHRVADFGQDHHIAGIRRIISVSCISSMLQNASVEFKQALLESIQEKENGKSGHAEAET